MVEYELLGLLLTILLVVTVIVILRLRNSVLVIRSNFTRIVDELRGELTSQRTTLESISETGDELRSELASQRIMLESISAIVTSQFDPHASIEPLIIALSQNDPSLRHAAQQILTQMGNASIKALAVAATSGRLPIPIATEMFMDCVESEDDLLTILEEGVGNIEICKEVLKHPKVGKNVLNYVAQNGSVKILTILVAMPNAQGTSAQKAAQKRIQEEVDRQERLQEEADRRQLEERSYRSYDEPTDNDWDDYDYVDDRATGTCDCRYR